MNNRPKVSIITPLYNSERFITDTIESVQRQTYADYEHIIIDDCSTDNSYALAAEKAERDKRIVLLHNERNSRVAHTRNRGIDIATGEYLMFLDSDDMFFEDTVETLVNCMLSTSGAEIYTASSQKMSEDGSVAYGTVPPPRLITYRKMLRKTANMPFMTTIVKREVVGEHRLKDVHHEDYLFWLEILGEGRRCFGYADRPLGLYRLTAHSLSRNKARAFRYQWNIYRRELNLGFFTSVCYFGSYACNGIYKLLKAVYLHPAYYRKK